MHVPLRWSETQNDGQIPKARSPPGLCPLSHASSVSSYALVYISTSIAAVINPMRDLTVGSRSLPLLSLKQLLSTSPLLSEKERLLMGGWLVCQGGIGLTLLQELLIANKARPCCGIKVHAGSHDLLVILYKKPYLYH